MQNELVTVKPYDMNDKIHYSEEFNLNGTGVTRLYLIEKQKLPTGIYYISIKTQNDITTQKLVVE